MTAPRASMSLRWTGRRPVDPAPRAQDAHQASERSVRRSECPGEPLGQGGIVCRRPRHPRCTEILAVARDELPGQVPARTADAAVPASQMECTTRRHLVRDRGDSSVQGRRHGTHRPILSNSKCRVLPRQSGKFCARGALEPATQARAQTCGSGSNVPQSGRPKPRNSAGGDYACRRSSAPAT